LCAVPPFLESLAVFRGEKAGPHRVHWSIGVSEAVFSNSFFKIFVFARPPLRLFPNGPCLSSPTASGCISCESSSTARSRSAMFLWPLSDIPCLLSILLTGFPFFPSEAGRKLFACYAPSSGGLFEWFSFACSFKSLNPPPPSTVDAAPSPPHAPFCAPSFREIRERRCVTPPRLIARLQDPEFSSSVLPRKVEVPQKPPHVEVFFLFPILSCQLTGFAEEA